MLVNEIFAHTPPTTVTHCTVRVNMITCVCGCPRASVTINQQIINSAESCDLTWPSHVAIPICYTFQIGEQSHFQYRHVLLLSVHIGRVQTNIMMLHNTYSLWSYQCSPRPRAIFATESSPKWCANFITYLTTWTLLAAPQSLRFIVQEPLESHSSLTRLGELASVDSGLRCGHVVPLWLIASVRYH